MNLRRLRRPIAVLLLVCAFVAFVFPPPRSRAEPISLTAAAAMTVGAGVAVHLGQVYGPHIAARVGPWAVGAASQGRALAARLGTFTRAGADKLVGFARDIPVTAGRFFGWAKKHPGDAAEIVDGVVGLVRALRDSGMEKTADAVGHALGQGGETLSSDSQVGDLVDIPGCGRMQITNVSTGYGWYNQNIDKSTSNSQTCSKTEKSTRC